MCKLYYLKFWHCPLHSFWALAPKHHRWSITERSCMLQHVGTSKEAALCFTHYLSHCFLPLPLCHWKVKGLKHLKSKTDICRNQLEIIKSVNVLPRLAKHHGKRICNFKSDFYVVMGLFLFKVSCFVFSTCGMNRDGFWPFIQPTTPQTSRLITIPVWYIKSVFMTCSRR